VAEGVGRGGRREIRAGLALRAWSRELLRELGLSHLSSKCVAICADRVPDLWCVRS
jgi:hypothetical protein